MLFRFRHSQKASFYWEEIKSITAVGQVPANPRLSCLDAFSTPAASTSLRARAREERSLSRLRHITNLQTVRADLSLQLVWSGEYFRTLHFLAAFCRDMSRVARGSSNLMDRSR